MTVTEHMFDTDITDLYDVLTEPRTYPEWLTGTKKMREVSPDWPAPKSYFIHVVGFGPVQLSDRTTVRDVAAPNMLELFVRARPALEAVVRFELDRVDGRTRLRMTETPSGVYKLISPVAQPLIKARNERSLRRLAALQVQHRRVFVSRQACGTLKARGDLLQEGPCQLGQLQRVQRRITEREDRQARPKACAVGVGDQVAAVLQRLAKPPDGRLRQAGHAGDFAAAQALAAVIETAQYRQAAKQPGDQRLS